MKLTQGQIKLLKQGDELLLKGNNMTRHVVLKSWEIKGWQDYQTLHLNFDDGQDYFFLLTAEQKKCPIIGENSYSKIWELHSYKCSFNNTL